MTDSVERTRGQDRAGDDTARLAAAFRRIAEVEFAPESPLYERLALAIADRPDLAVPLLAAPPQQRRPLLYFAAVAHVLRTIDPVHPLAAWYPVLGGRRAARDGDPAAALADFVDTHRDSVKRLCATKITQTNEVRRAALVRPAFGRAADIIAEIAAANASDGTGEMALIELGTSAGLLLATDRYGIRYHSGDRTRTLQSGALTIDCELRDGRWPEPVAAPMRVWSRTGIDLSPIPPGDTDGIAWLHACVWPEHTDRDAQLDLALGEVAVVKPKMVAADMRSGLAAAIDAVPPHVTPCVFTSHAIVYMDADGRAELVRSLAAIGAERDLVVVMNEASVLHAWSAPVPRFGEGITTHVTLVAWQAAKATVEVLAEGDPHGRWLRFEPRGYPYVPPALSDASDV